VLKHTPTHLTDTYSCSPLTLSKNSSCKHFHAHYNKHLHATIYSPTRPFTRPQVTAGTPTHLHPLLRITLRHTLSASPEDCVGLPLRYVVFSARLRRCTHLQATTLSPTRSITLAHVTARSPGASTQSFIHARTYRSPHSRPHAPLHSRTLPHGLLAVPHTPS
jgi:hypothetical protein